MKKKIYEKPVVEYICRCGAKFLSVQGSQRSLCDECLVKAVTKRKRVEKEE